MAGFNGSTAFLQKEDFNGNPIWTNALPSRSRIDFVYATSVAVYSAGSNLLDLSNISAGWNTELRAYGLDGKLSWTKSFTNSTYSSFIYAATDGVYLAGDNSTVKNDHGFLSKYDLSGNLQWTQGRNANAQWRLVGFSGDSSGIYASWDESALRLANSDDGPYIASYLTKYDGNGRVTWDAKVGDASDGIDAGQVAAGPSGTYLSTFTQFGSYNIIRKLDGNGNGLWSLPFRQKMESMSSGQNGVYIGGSNESSSGGSALVVGIGPSASLILFGVHSPYSFLILGTIIGVPVLAIVWKWRKMQTNVPIHNVPRHPTDLKVRD